MKDENQDIVSSVALEAADFLEELVQRVRHESGVFTAEDARAVTEIKNKLLDNPQLGAQVQSLMGSAYAEVDELLSMSKDDILKLVGLSKEADTSNAGEEGGTEGEGNSEGGDAKSAAISKYQSTLDSYLLDENGSVSTSNFNMIAIALMVLGGLIVYLLFSPASVEN